MGKFNKNAQGAQQPKVRSHEGGVTFKATPYQDLCDRVLTSFFGEDKFYESGKQESRHIIQLIHEVGKHDPIFVAKLAVLAREEFKLRSVSQVLVAELSKIYRGDSRMKKAIKRVIKRPDDMTEILGYIISSSTITKLPDGRTRRTNKSIPNSIKKGIAEAFVNFDEYQLSKYGSSRKEVTLKDVIKLTHPTPKDQAQSVVFKQVMDGTLKKAETWERKISDAGQGNKTKTEVEQAKKDNWEQLIMDKKLGYMATLRNINNFLSSGISKEAHAQACAYLSNEKAVLNSKQLPFRFYSAYKVLEQNSRGNDPFIIKEYLKALATAMKVSVANMTKIPGRTMVVADNSGSMTCKTSANSTVSCQEIASLMCAIVAEMCDDAITASFASTFEVVNLNSDNILENANKIIRTNVGYATNMHLVFEYLIRNNISVDNIIVLSDMQITRYINMDQYRKQVNKDAVLYEWNLKGYGNNIANASNANQIQLSGWSDNMIKYVSEYQQLKNGIIDMVNAVEL